MSVAATSIEIFNKITNENLLSKKRGQVYKIVYAHGPMTGSQVSKIFKERHISSQHSESIRNRITELVQQGVVIEVGAGKCPITHNHVLWFDTTNYLPQNLKRKLTQKEKKKKLIDKIYALGVQLNGQHRVDLLEIYELVIKI